MDSIGEWELQYGKGEGDKLTKVYSIKVFSVGLFIVQMTPTLRISSINKDEYKIVRMAKEGTDSYVGLVKKELIEDDLNGYVSGVPFPSITYIEVLTG